MFLSQEILEHILKYADGETLLMCRDVSPEFEDAINYLSKRSSIWQDCYLKEKEEYPFCPIYKIHPHSEGLSHCKNWGVIYETSFLSNFMLNKEPSYLSEYNIGKEYCYIQDMETHEDLVLVLVKYNKDFSIYYKIITITLDNKVVDKSCRFFANMLYLTPVEDPSNARNNAIILPCDSCLLVAIPVCVDVNIKGLPRFTRQNDFLTIEHSNGDYLWISNFGKFLTKGNCFHIGKDIKYEEIKLKDLQLLKVYQEFTTLFISCGETQREFNTFKDLKANVTASFSYCSLLILGTDTGMLYAYHLKNESGLKNFSLNSHIWNFDVCSNSILVINVMELKKEFVIVCCCQKSVHHIHFKRKLKNHS